jgi:sterol desaturase/sphingolipid hydroxylase (fatty acid hydroxylase superfamily)
MSIAIFLTYIRTLYGVPFRLDTQSLPNLFEILWQFIFSMIVEDFTFYITHRMLHHNLIYKYFHK